MKYNIFIISLFIVLTFAFTACQPPPPPPPPEPVVPEEPPEPTPDVYQGQVKSLLGTLLIPGTPAPPDDAIQGIISQVQTKRSQLALTENGVQAISLITRDVDESIRVTKEEERWKKVKALCMIYSALQPGNERYSSLLEQASMMMNRPEITVTGFVELDGELYAFLDLFDPKTGEATSYRRREGEEFHDVMRIVRIVGNQQSVEVEYLPARYVWTLPGPRERAKTGAQSAQ